MPDRQIDYGEDAEDATYRSGDAGGTTGGGNFVVAELLGDRVLFEWDQTANEWVSRGPVNLSGNDLANVGTLSATDLNADSVNTESLNNADLANAVANTVPTSQGDGTLAMQEAGGGLDPQGYANKTSERAPSTVYQNTTGRPLEVKISASSTQDPGRWWNQFLDVGPDTNVEHRVSRHYTRLDDDTLLQTQTGYTSTATIPDGWYYEFLASPDEGSPELQAWFEQEL